MTIASILGPVTGDWVGTNRLRIMPDDEFTPSESTARVEVVAGGNAATINYTWSGDGGQQSGVILLAQGSEPESIAAVFLDSWHQHPQWMEFSGAIVDDKLVVEANYGPGDPVAKWRIHAGAQADGSLLLRMDNVYGEADYQVVDTQYHRS